MSFTNPHDREREEYARFALQFSDPDYRAALIAVYGFWGQINRRHFSSRLKPPHIRFGTTASKRVWECKAVTGHGAQLEMTFNEKLAFGPNDWVTNPLVINGPRERVVNPQSPTGTLRFLEDTTLAATDRQYVLEVDEDEEQGYRGFGPCFVEQANRIAVRLGLAPVEARNRDGDEPLANAWPYNVRLRNDPHYYGDDVTTALLDLVAGTRNRMQARRVPPKQGVWEWMNYLYAADRHADLGALFRRQLDWFERLRELHKPALRRVEAGLEDVDGTPLSSVPTICSEWVTWNGGLVGKVTESIFHDRSYIYMPILGDALEEAGCTDAAVLRHCRSDREHTISCWVIQGILAQLKE